MYHDIIAFEYPEEILNEGGKKSYNFARQFLGGSGIETILNTDKGACKNNKDPTVYFHLSYYGINDPKKLDPLDSISFKVEEDLAKIFYHRRIVSTFEEQEESKEMIENLGKRVKELGFEYHPSEIDNRYYAGIKAKIPYQYCKVLRSLILAVETLSALDRQKNRSKLFQ